MGVFKMEWRIGEEVCGWVGLQHFSLMMIFWRLGNLNYCCKRKRMKVAVFWVPSFNYYYVFWTIESCFSRLSQGVETTWPSQSFRIQTNSSMASKSFWTFSSQLIDIPNHTRNEITRFFGGFQKQTLLYE